MNCCTQATVAMITRHLVKVARCPTTEHLYGIECSNGGNGGNLSCSRLVRHSLLRHSLLLELSSRKPCQAAHPIRIRSTVQVYMSSDILSPGDDVTGIEPLFSLNCLTSKVQEKCS